MNSAAKVQQFFETAKKKQKKTQNPERMHSTTFIDRNVEGQFIERGCP